MNWQDIKLSADATHFLYNGEQIFNKRFADALKFHSPGLAAVVDESGAYHINTQGRPLYDERYTRTFGYYCNRATVNRSGEWYHLDGHGIKAYTEAYQWAGNYQENICPVRGSGNRYFHVDLDGNRIYEEDFVYAGDYKDGIACVKTSKGLYRHIDTSGRYVHGKEYHDLGIFHKNYATAKDEKGWHHIDKAGKELYPGRYVSVEPFYNGFALVELSGNKKRIINEHGDEILFL